MNKRIIIVPHHPDYSYGSSFEDALPEEASYMSFTVIRVNRKEFNDDFRQVEQYVDGAALTLLVFHGTDPTDLDPDDSDDGMDYVKPALIRRLIDTGRVFIATYGSESKEEIRFLLKGPQEEEIAWVQQFDKFWCKRRLASERAVRRKAAYEQRFDQLLTTSV